MDISSLHASGSVVIAASPDALYEFIADMPSIGEISAQCTGGVWESDARGVGALFVGSNTWGETTWKARMRVTVADPGREFAWENLGAADAPAADDAPGLVRWGYTFEPVDGGTRVEETWRILRPYPELESATAEDFERLIRNFT
ncbi:MAG TPA: SRPBCC family protein, partial [Acidimicrobiia bacterium]|nr:SRPBCC family protein [Acidimicrobiia bacterium]